MTQRDGIALAVLELALQRDGFDPRQQLARIVAICLQGVLQAAGQRKRARQPVGVVLGLLELQAFDEHR